MTKCLVVTPEDPIKVLGRTFEEAGGYDDMVLVKDISFHSHCEPPHGADHRQSACGLSAR